MKFPIKLNATRWPPLVCKLLPHATDPRALCFGALSGSSFSEAVSTFKFGSTFKTTQKARFPLTVALLSELEFVSLPIVLDVGASDGSTASDVLNAIPIQRYYLTDLNTELHFIVQGGTTWFYSESGACILAVMDHWVVYSDTRDSVFPFGWISENVFRQAPIFDAGSKKISLINPTVQSINKNTSLLINKYDVFKNWEFEKVDLIIVANLFNRAYFSEQEIRFAVTNLLTALNDYGRIAIIDNRSVEKSSIFQVVDGTASVEESVNGGTEIEALALEALNVDRLLLN